MNTQAFKRSALAAGAAAVALTGLALPGAAAAQYRYTPSYGSSYDQAGGYYYDGCARSEANRAVVGGIVGAVAGAAIGNNTGSRRRSDENALIGGLLGAAVGAGVGKSTAACQPEPRPQTRAYNSYGYNNGYGSNQGYDYGYGRGYDYQDYGYGRGYDDYSYGYGGYGYDNRASGQCRYVEDQVRLPDGRVQTRMVQACRDSSGRYQIVQ